MLLCTPPSPLLEAVGVIAERSPIIEIKALVAEAPASVVTDRVEDHSDSID
jgi:hypothetical protein